MTSCHLPADKLELVIKIIESTGYPLFGLDVKRDEIDQYKSFFIYVDGANLKRAQSSFQFLVDFELTFVTVENAEIDELDLARKLKRCGLIFNHSATEIGKMANTEASATLVSMNFHHVVKECCK